MSTRRKLETRIRSLDEIREILNAMKNLALMETHRLARQLDAQRRVVTAIESAAADFLGSYPELAAIEEQPFEVDILLGSERGFCGDFNESLLRIEEARRQTSSAACVAVGARLASAMPAIPGAGVAEEVDAVLSRLLEELNRLSASRAVRGALRLTVLHHDPEKDGVQVSTLKPFQRQGSSRSPVESAPVLYLEPRAFLAGLTEQYLVALLEQLLCRSLMAENQRRMQHMDSAVRLLERSVKELRQQRNRTRQEETTEEIEVIMLSVQALH